VIERAFQTPQSYNLLRIRRWQILIDSLKIYLEHYYPKDEASQAVKKLQKQFSYIQKFRKERLNV